MDKIHEASKALVELSWWVQRKGPMRAGIEVLPSTEVVILGYMEDHPGTITTEISEALDIKPSNVSAAVRALVEKGLVEKTPDVKDGRKSRLHLSELARKNKGTIDAAVMGSIDEVLTQLSPEHRDSLFQALEALSEVAKRLR